MIVQSRVCTHTRFSIHLFSVKAAEAFAAELALREGVYEVVHERAWVRFFTTLNPKLPPRWAQEFEKEFVKRLAAERVAKATSENTAAVSPASEVPKQPKARAKVEEVQLPHGSDGEEHAES